MQSVFRFKIVQMAPSGGRRVVGCLGRYVELLYVIANIKSDGFP